MTIIQLITQYSKRLKSSSPLLDIELLIAQALKIPKEYLYAHPEQNLTTKQLNNFTTLFKRRAKGEPIAYILGHKEFYRLDFKVNKNVLIPRPETEQLVDEVINFAKKRQPLAIFEIGVGSGAVIISLAKNLPKSQCLGTDISTKALTVAKQNAKLHGVFCHPELSRRIDRKPYIKFYRGNLLKPISELKSFQFPISNYILVSNLPYLTTKQLNNTQLKFEPRQALNGGPDGLKYFREFFNQIHQYKLKPLAIFLEIGDTQGSKISKLAKLALPRYKIKIKKDLCGLDRIICITK